MDLESEVVIVTGAARGIGKAIAKRFIEEGSRVIIADIDIEQAEKSLKEITESEEQGKAIKVDITNKKENINLIETALSTYGKVDVLVNNAAVVERQPFLDITEESWDKVINVNLKGTYLCTQAFAKAVVNNDGKGKIINLASICGVVVNPYANLCAYEVSKAGIVMLTKRMGFELASKNINVNAIAPSIVKTRLLQSENEQKLLNNIPLGRISTPEDLAGTAVFLASEESDYITGTTIYVDGGWLTH